MIKTCARLFLIPTLLFTLTLPVGAAAEDAALESGRLAVAGDPYSQVYRLGADSRRYAGQDIDTQRFRPAVIVDETDEYLEFANYMHEGRYWIARLSKKAEVERMFAHVVRFPAVPGVTAAHTQYRVVFKAGSELELRSQVDGETRTARVRDAIVSAEAARPAGVPYNFAEGLVPNYATIKRIVSGAQRLTEYSGTRTEQYEVTLPPELVREGFIESIRESAAEKAARAYGTVSPNCTTDLFALIDWMLAKQGRTVRPFYTQLSNDPIARPTLEGLTERRVLGDRYADLDGELERGETAYVPRAEDHPAALGVFPEGLASSYSLVTHVPGEERLSAEEAEMLKAARARLATALESVFQAAFSTVALGQSADAATVFREGLGQLQASLAGILRDVDARLPEGFDRTMLVYFAPYEGAAGERVNLEIEDRLHARLPFKVYRAGEAGLAQIRAAPAKIRAAFAAEAAREGVKLPRFHFFGVAAHLNLKKGASSVRLQIVGGLNPSTQVLNERQGPIFLFSLNGLNPRIEPEDNRSLMVLEIDQMVRPGAENVEWTPEFDVRFGRDVGERDNMVLDPRRADFGLFDLSEGMAGPTFGRLRQVPYFLGEDYWLGVDFRFPLLGMRVSTRTLEISKLDIRLYKPGLGLQLEHPAITRKFTDGLNAQIQACVAKLR